MNYTFEEIYKTYKNEVNAWVLMLIKNKSEAEEIANDIFMQVHKHLASFDSKQANVRTWLYTITKHRVIDVWRKQKKNDCIQHISDYVDDEGNETFQLHSYCDSPQEIMENDEVGTDIQTAISGLSSTYKDIAILFFNEQLSYDEIAERLDIPLGTVKGKINRLKDILQNKLNKYSYKFNTEKAEF